MLKNYDVIVNVEYEVYGEVNDKQISELQSNNSYMRLFLSDIALRESCYNCSFKKKYRNSDITLADFWGISNIHPDMNDNMGTSLVIVNTEKGNELFNSIRDSIVYKETDILETLRKIQKCIDEMDFAGASKLIRESDRKKMPKQYQDIFQEISGWMDEMEVDKIQELLGQIISMKKD